MGMERGLSLCVCVCFNGSWVMNAYCPHRSWIEKNGIIFRFVFACGAIDDLCEAFDLTN